MSERLIGEHIVIDSEVCDGVPTFRGTRILVSSVLEQVAQGMEWDEIIAESRGSITREAIAEAVWVAGGVFVDHARVPPKHELDAPPTVLGRYVVADPAICHGAVTFRGTRLFVSDALNMVADGMRWEDIVAECHGSITPEAIAEAVRLAGEVSLHRATGLDLQTASR